MVRAPSLKEVSPGDCGRGEQTPTSFLGFVYTSVYTMAYTHMHVHINTLVKDYFTLLAGSTISKVVRWLESNERDR